MGSEAVGRAVLGPTGRFCARPPPWLVDSGRLHVPTASSLHVWLCPISRLSEEPVTVANWSPL